MIKKKIEYEIAKKPEIYKKTDYFKLPERYTSDNSYREHVY